MDEKQHRMVKLSVFISEPVRLDRYLAGLLRISRVQVKAMIQLGNVLCNDHHGRPSQLVSGKDMICLTFVSEVAPSLALAVTVLPDVIQTSDWTIPILYSDDDVLVINKPAGLVVHGASSLTSVTLVDVLLAGEIPLKGGDHDRVGIVHRLDQFTEGIMVLSKSERAFSGIQQQFKDRVVSKKYYAVLQGVLAASEGVIDRPIGRDASVRARQSCHHYVEGTGKDATTTYNVLNQFTNISFVDVALHTGRTHQIRVHFSSINCPVLGDSLYSKQSKKREGYYLQSYFLEFSHPVSGECLQFKLPVSDRLKKYAGHNGNAK